MKRIFTLLALVALALPLLAQSPDLMTYQAVLRDTENHLITDQAVAVQISILQGAPNGTAVFTEVHSISTNENGLISLEIGDGVGDDLSTVDWGAGPYYLKTETDPAGGSNYTITSTTQLLSVPYAKYADEAGNAFSGAYGDLSGAPTVVSAFTNDEGYLTSELWSLNGSDVYYNGGNVGIGTNTPVRPFTIHTGASPNYSAWQNDATGSGGTQGVLVGVDNDQHGYLWNWNLGNLYFGTNNIFRMTITGAGDIGIGTTAPTARLDVRGGTKIGVSGVTFNELREITGTTIASGTQTVVPLPSGYNADNTRVLSAEVQLFGDRWVGLGSNHRAVPAGNITNTSYLLLGTTLYLFNPDNTDYQDKAYRILIMQIAP